jgi:hypothetical protein
MRRQEEMPGTARTKPRWGPPLVSLIALVVVIAMSRGAWEIALGTTIVALLAGGYLLRRKARRPSGYDHHAR